MIIPPNSASVHATRVPQAPAGDAAKPAALDLLRNLMIVDQLSELVGAATPFPIDNALDSFWEGMIDDCAYRTGPELARHNYHRDLGHLENKGRQLLRTIDEMPATTQRAQAREKLALFLDSERAHIESRYQLEMAVRPPVSMLSRPAPAVAPLDMPPPPDALTP